MLIVSFNAFACSEHIIEAATRIKESGIADQIHCAYQMTSYSGIPIDRADLVRYRSLPKDFFDYVYELTPYPMQIKNPKENERWKRQCQLDVAVKRGAEYFMSIDEDEMYNPDELKEAFDEFKQSTAKESFCQMLTFYKRKDVIITPPEEYWVQLFVRTNGADYLRNKPKDIKVDPSRKSFNAKENILCFSRSQIQMLHYSYIRNNIRHKLHSQPAGANFRNRIDDIVKHYESFEYPGEAYLGGTQVRKYKTKIWKN